MHTGDTASVLAVRHRACHTINLTSCRYILAMIGFIAKTSKTNDHVEAFMHPVAKMLVGQQL